MSFSSSSSQSSCSRDRLGLALAALLSILSFGCFNDPKIDPTQTYHCKDDKSCPWGSVCGANDICCESTDGKTCKVPPPSGGLDATALDSQAGHDIAIRETGLGTGGVASMDSGQGTGGAWGWDGSIDLMADVPLDGPPTTSSEAGAGGVPGTGGAGPIDAPNADALDAPLGGTGGGSGGSGTGGGSGGSGTGGGSGGSGSGGNGTGGESGGSGGTGAPGQTCQSSATCASGLSCSSDGHCCDRACAGTCESCETGACKPVTGAPHAGHGSCTGTSSDCSGSCTGAANGQCTWPTTPCGVGSCTTLTNTQSQPTGTTLVPQGACSAGACLPGTTTSCAGNLVCASTTACKTSCTTDADCVTGNGCSGGSGTCAKNAFISGPCATSPDLSSVEVFASSGQKIYRRVISGSSSGSWASIPALDATKLDARSDLDCSSNSNTVHIVASGASPTGSYMHATGFGTSYNAFTRELSTNSPSTFGYIGVSIAAWPNSTDVTYQMAAVPASGMPSWVTFDGTTYGGYTPTVDYALTSAPDIAYQQGNGDNPNHAEMVAFTGNGMVYFDHTSGFGSGWQPNTYWLPPASATYSYSPTLCNHSDPTTSDYRRYTAAVAGGKLYVAYSQTDWTTASVDQTTFSAWELSGNSVPASSPDCVVTADNTLHIVILTSTGTIAHVYRTGVSGSWTTQDLGTFWLCCILSSPLMISATELRTQGLEMRTARSNRGRGRQQRKGGSSHRCRVRYARSSVSRGREWQSGGMPPHKSTVRKAKRPAGVGWASSSK